MSFTVFYLTLMALAFLFLRKKDISVPLPNVLTVLGVLGTFIGIFWGLMDFDTNDIQGSVPPLLEGLKFAFLTSIAGMASSIAIRVAPAFTGKEIAKTRGATLDTVTSLLSDSIDAQRNIERALTGDGETTVLTQLQKLRTGFMDKQDELVTEFRDFASNMAENNQKALIDALTEVMRDFNAKINEQFGDNFRQLNEAVGRMLTWQEQYGNQVEHMVEQLNATVEAARESQAALGDLTTKSAAYQQTADSLSTVLSALHEQTQKLSAGLQAFAEVGESARQALPVIEDKLRALTEASTTLVETARQGISDQSSALRDSHETLNSEMRTIITGVSGQIEQMMNQNATNIAQQVTALDESLGKELTKSLNTLGSQLTALSEKFVSDYTPLTERLQELVALAEGTRR